MIHVRTGLHKIILLFFAAALFPFYGFTQNTTIVDTAHPTTATIIAGKEYKKGGLGKFFWGEHYRKEWTAPVKVLKLRLDTAYGGLVPVEKGGGRQTKNLRLDAPNKRQYAIRSINKDYGKALPEVAQGTFIESIIKDQMSVAHPYAGVTLAPLSGAAKIYTTAPKIRFIGNDPELGKFGSEFQNELYSLEDRPTDQNAKFYGAKDVLDTEEFLKKILEDNDHRADGASFVRARLFDMFIGDWDRHDDQWKWAEYEENGRHIYKAIPKDRDQAYSKFDGLFVKMGAKATHLPYLQGFNNELKDVEGFNLEARPLDIQLTSELTLQNWQDIARDMQQSLTDGVIENAIGLLPPEVYAISGKEIIEKLKSRREHLLQYAEEYYRNLAKEADITASKKDELIEVTGLDKDHVQVRLFDLNRNGEPKKTPFYSRTFSGEETKEIRIFGIGGNDRFVAAGNTGNNILVRLIGGEEKDDYNIPATYAGRVKIYDNPSNTFNTANTKKYLSTDTTINLFNRKLFKQSSSGIGPRLGYNNDDRIFVGLGYKIKKQQWRKAPFGYSHDLSVIYSITQKAFRFLYQGVFNEAIGKWNLGLLADYDLVKDAYFMGVGNNTTLFTDKRQYFLYRNKEFDGALNVNRIFDSVHTISFTGFYQNVELLNDTGRYLSQYYAPAHPGYMAAQNFAGLRAEYDYTRVKDKIAPNRGMRFHAGAEYTRNLENTNSVTRFSGLFGFFVPLGPFTLAIKTGAATLTGDPEFYQLNKIGGGPTLRGFTRYRFYGKSMFFNQNELQWNFDVKTYLFSGKMGLVALFDNGRVWMPGETSDQWHTAVGGGLMLAPFNFISITGTYAVSKEDQRISVRFGHFLKR
jgi:hypothetical protein